MVSLLAPSSEVIPVLLQRREVGCVQRAHEFRSVRKVLLVKVFWHCMDKKKFKLATSFCLLESGDFKAHDKEQRDWS